MGQLARERVRNIPLVKPAGYRSSHGWLMVRHQSFWRLDESEISERLLSPLEQALRKGQTLTIDDYAGLAAELKPEHRAAFGMDRIGLFEFSHRPFSDDWSMLHLWGNMSPDQRRDTIGDGCDVSSLTPEAQADLRLVLDDWSWEQAQPPSIAATVRRRGIGAVAGILRCRSKPYSSYYDLEATPNLGGPSKTSHYASSLVFELELPTGTKLTLGGFSTDAP